MVISYFTRLIAGLWNDQSKNRGSYYLISSSAYIFSYVHALCWVNFCNCSMTPQPHPPCWVKLNNEGNSLPLGIRDPGCRSSLKNGWAHASIGLMREEGVAILQEMAHKVNYFRGCSRSEYLVGEGRGRERERGEGERERQDRHRQRIRVRKEVRNQ